MGALELDRSPAASVRWASRGWQVALWIGLAIAFSPVLLDLVSHTEDQPWTRVSLVFPLLVWVAARRDTVRPGPAAWGWALVASGIALELLAIGGDVLRLGRIGLAAAAIGLCFAGGWTSVRVALLFAWSIPFPAALLNRLGPGFEGAVMGLGAELASIFGFQVSHSAGLLEGPSGVLEIVASDGGLQTAYVLAGLGWFQAIWRRENVAGILRRAGLFALGAVPLHLALAFAAAVALAMGAAPSTIRDSLSGFAWLGIPVVGLAGVFLSAIRPRRESGVEA